MNECVTLLLLFLVPNDSWISQWIGRGQQSSSMRKSDRTCLSGYVASILHSFQTQNKNNPVRQVLAQMDHSLLTISVMCFVRSATEYCEGNKKDCSNNRFVERVQSRILMQWPLDNDKLSSISRFADCGSGAFGCEVCGQALNYQADTFLLTRGEN